MAEQTLVDDAYYSSPSIIRPFYRFYSKFRSRSFYLYFILEMKNIFGKINKYSRIVINTLIRIILVLLYFTLFFIIGIIIRVCTDFLGTKNKTPAWLPQEPIKAAGEFLSRQ